MRERYTPSLIEQRLEKRLDRPSLRDAVGGDECERRVRVRGQVVCGLAEPSRHVVEVSVASLAPYGLQVGVLLGAFRDVAGERRVAHHIVALACGKQRVPVVSERVRPDDVSRVPEREARQRGRDDAFRVRQHLLFGDPQCGAGDRAGEPVDLYAVEPVDRHPHRSVPVPQVEL